jgi:gluconokinase
MPHRKPNDTGDDNAAGVIVIMGVAGAGKTTVGQALAGALGWSFLDADAMHRADDVARMRDGVPMTDETRLPWLDRIRARLEAQAAAGKATVLACSALKQSYRDRLWHGPGRIDFVYLKGDPALYDRRLRARPDHFMKAEMLESQLTALEEPREALVIDAALPVDAIVAKIRAAL